jgi:hypothetical protein
MKYTPPLPVDLSSDEQAQFDLLTSEDTSSDWAVQGKAMESLVESLRQRGVIPEIRLRVFTDAAFAETGSKSPMQVFERNGTTGGEILRHPHFVPYLRYFIKGPSLPAKVISGLCQLLNEDAGTSGEVMTQYRRFARESVRTYGLKPKNAATEFFRLGVEIGMSVDEARILRDAALSA